MFDSTPRDQDIGPNKPREQSYDEFYRHGGWTYDTGEELLFLVYRVLQPLGLRAGGRVLDLGCGRGLHAALWHQLGFSVHAVDSSSVAIARAMAEQQGPTFECADARDVLSGMSDGVWDVVFARGLSWFHHWLGPGPNTDGVDVRREMREIMRVLQQEGTFVLQVRTDFSGRIDPTGIRHHTYAEIMELLSAAGEVALFTDWCGMPITNADIARRSGRNALCAVRHTAWTRTTTQR
jgi:SAM-dependent methyltransferase